MITVVGEALVDIVRTADGAERAHAGGSPANVAVGLSRLGSPVSLLTCFGADAYGDLLARHLADNGVVLLGDVPGGDPTSVAAARLDATGAATYDFAITWDLGDDVPAPPEGSLALHTGSIAAVLEPGATAVRSMVERARGRMTVSYDPNARPSLMGDPSDVRRRVEDIVARCDVVKVSDEDLAWLVPDRADEEVARTWLATGPALVVVTRGSGGAYAVTPAGEARVTAVAVDVADTVGAGDAFTAGLLDGLRRRDLLGPQARDDLAGLTGGNLAAVVRRAAVVAALTVARPGADPPTAVEVDTHSGA